jgi:Na+/H+-dicarboxylate symporter
MKPVSIADAAAQNKILQIVVFSAFVGVAIGGLGERAMLVRSFAEQLALIMFKVAGVIIRAAPIAVFAAMAATTLEHGVGTVATLGRYVVVFYLGLVTMAAALIAVGAAFLGPQIGGLLKAMREPMLIAFSTASSEATLPSTFEAVGKLGVSPRIAGLVLPMGYAFNLSGTLIYSSFAVLFIAQAYGIAMPVSSQIGMLLFLMVANKGAAGVPRGALITLTLTLQTFGLPLEGIAIILGVEALLDMGRTTINVLGNAIATASIARLSGDMEPA